MPNVFKADLLYLRGEENGELSLNRLSMRARDEYTRAAGKSYVFGQIEGLRDTFKDIDYLMALSVGLGHKVRDTPDCRCSSTPASASRSRRTWTAPSDRRVPSPPASASRGALSKHATLTQSLAALWTIDRFGDALYTFKAGLTADLTRRSQIKVEVVDLYKTRPPAVTVEKNDVSLVTSLVYKF